jgi:hypothetical protein
MKSFFLIIGLYMLYLSCLPCGDNREFSTKSEEKVSAAANKKEHQHGRDTCTPFCTCSCCSASGFDVSFSKPQVQKIFPLVEKEFSTYNVCFTSQVYFAIWQPPKIS